MPFPTAIGSDLALAAEWLRRGEAVGIPTETVYGLAADALDPLAVSRVFEAKQRPSFDPLIVHVASRGDVGRYARAVPAAAATLMERFWPGPLTVLLPRRPLIPDLVTAGLPDVALRMPAHPLALELLRALPFPLAAPSANPFGYISPTTARHVLDQLGGRIPYILDGGPCRIGVESTIVGFPEDRPVVHRLGGIALEELEAVVGPVATRLQQGANPAAPGMLESHYAPRKPLALGDLGRLLREHHGRRVAVLSLRPLEGVPPDVRALALTSAGDLHEAAARLFACLRELDASDAGVILAEPVPDHGLGRAINDRLRRAAVR